MATWSLADADAIAEANKYTFYKPSRDVIAKVKPGETVKLIFEFESEKTDAPSAERMWVLVDSIGSDGVFLGRLDNQPAWITNLAPGDPVRFSASHIINTEHDDKDNFVDAYSKRCFVTNRVLRDGIPVGYLYREDPDEEQDSGWRFSANDESEEYMNDTNNIQYVSVGLVLSKDDSFIHLLNMPSRSSFARDPKTNGFVPVRSET